jgi:hypothetical protein
VVILGIVAVLGLAVALVGASGPSRPVAVAPIETAEPSTPAPAIVESAAVPALIGLTGDEAGSLLLAASLLPTYDGGEDSVWAPSNWTVISQSPEPGASVEVGSSVTLFVEKTAPGEDAPPETGVAPPAAGLADAVWAQVNGGFPDGISVESPLFAVTGVEDVGAGTIRVLVQENLSDAQRAEVARHVFNLGAWDNTALSIVVVPDASGVDSNHYRRDYPYLPQ